MKKTLLIITLLSWVITGCHRSSREVWEDSKSASRYMGKGLKSLLGRHADAPDFAYWEDWSEGNEGSPLSLGADDTYGGSSTHFGELSMSDAPPPRESPGDPGSSIPGIDGFSAPTGELARLFHNIHFETDSYTLQGRENLESLQAIASYLMKNRGTYVFIEGHSDERASAAYNFALSAKRAQSIRSFLVQNGVNPDQLFTVSYGKEKPLVDGHDESAWWQNRRGQFRLYER